MSSKTKILYVEDELYLGKIVKESLESRDFEVKMLMDGLNVLPIVEDFQPHICVLDVMLPKKDGFTVGQEIRSRQPDLPIIYLTAKNQLQDIIKGFDSGGNDYIKKPFSMEELIIRINNILKLSKQGIKENANGSDSIISLGSYHFYPNKFELRLQDEVRKLSNRETQLLKIFANHKNQTISRKDILLKVWGDDSIFNSRNMDVYIKKIRAYLKHDNNLEIVTLKGFGYHFVVEE